MLPLDNPWDKIITMISSRQAEVPALKVGSRISETRYGATQNDRWHNIPGLGRTRKLKTGTIWKLTPRFLVGGYDAQIAWDDGTTGSRVADFDHLLLLDEAAIHSSKESSSLATSKPAALPSIGEEDSIRKYAESRGIDELLHFTRTGALSSIVENGLLSNASLRKLGKPVLDEYRYDGKSEYVCLSIGFPNYQMMYSYTQGAVNDWCILVIDASIIWKKKCLFYPFNAASTDLAKKPTSNFEGVNALKSLYSPLVQDRNRHPALPLSYPTSPQAEVLVKGNLATDDIVGVYFSSFLEKSKYAQMLGDGHEIWSVVSKGLFAPRIDWERWKRG